MRRMLAKLKLARPDKAHPPNSANMGEPTERNFVDIQRKLNFSLSKRGWLNYLYIIFGSI